MSSVSVSVENRAEIEDFHHATFKLVKFEKRHTVNHRLEWLWKKCGYILGFSQARKRPLSTLPSLSSYDGSYLPATLSSSESLSCYNNATIVELKQAFSSRKLNLSDFKIIRTIGMGSFGVVCLAEFKSEYSFAPVALKIVKKELLKRKNQLAIIREEKKILSSLNNSFIVNLFACFQDDSHYVFVMEYVNGGELFGRLRKVKKFPEAVACFYAAEVVVALEYLHSLNIAYRDLKPENILIDPLGHIRLVDFGLAKVLQKMAVTVCGTNEYLAPETLIRRGYGLTVDWWAFGILLFEMLAGYPPFYDASPFSLFCKILSHPVTFPAHISSSSKSLINKLLCKDPSKRLGAAGNVRDVRKHRFFRKISWPACRFMKLEPPFVPVLSDITDSSHFEEYPEFIVSTEPEGRSSRVDESHFGDF
ncbi:AGC kinase [Cardiosporidium cionae]|uniref:AGC kinase n=1 Tax=Cardiosporidium cionae TaxID=476202 RepID=A0ABQ7JD87_9APIC|nr:AGC kinase [Cardiosporidium cionae]|eukprot:KAF8822006.1 AGC kinase [Cardiosporidium cionae]